MTTRADPAGAGHRILPHTADLMLEAWGPTVERCLAEAVRALTDSYADLGNASTTVRHEFRLAESGPDELLLALLEQAVYLLDARGVVVLAAHVAPPGDGELSGWFDCVDVEDVTLIGSVPKGIALSGLRMDERGGEWRCTAIVDV